MRKIELLNGRARREFYPAALLLALLGSWAATADSPAITAASPAFRKQEPEVGILACRDLLRAPAEAWCEPAYTSASGSPGPASGPTARAGDEGSGM